jgi:hypothetical protein
MRHTREQMQEIIHAWSQSGLSKKEFCRQQNITYSNFHYWCKRLRTPSTPGFAELQVPDTSSGCEVIFPSGVRLLLQGEPSVNWLRSLVS